MTAPEPEHKDAGAPKPSPRISLPPPEKARMNLEAIAARHLNHQAGGVKLNVGKLMEMLESVHRIGSGESLPTDLLEQADALIEDVLAEVLTALQSTAGKFSRTKAYARLEAMDKQRPFPSGQRVRMEWNALMHDLSKLLGSPLDASGAAEARSAMTKLHQAHREGHLALGHAQLVDLLENARRVEAHVDVRPKSADSSALSSALLADLLTSLEKTVGDASRKKSLDRLESMDAQAGFLSDEQRAQIKRIRPFVPAESGGIMTLPMELLGVQILKAGIKRMQSGDVDHSVGSLTQLFLPQRLTTDSIGHVNKIKGINRAMNDWFLREGQEADFLTVMHHLDRMTASDWSAKRGYVADKMAAGILSKMDQLPTDEIADSDTLDSRNEYQGLGKVSRRSLYIANAIANSKHFSHEDLSIDRLKHSGKGFENFMKIAGKCQNLPVDQQGLVISHLMNKILEFEKSEEKKRSAQKIIEMIEGGSAGPNGTMKLIPAHVRAKLLRNLWGIAKHDGNSKLQSRIQSHFKTMMEDFMGSRQLPPVLSLQGRSGGEDISGEWKTRLMGIVQLIPFNEDPDFHHKYLKLAMSAPEELRIYFLIEPMKHEETKWVCEKFFDDLSFLKSLSARDENRFLVQALQNYLEIEEVQGDKAYRDAVAALEKIPEGEKLKAISETLDLFQESLLIISERAEDDPDSIDPEMMKFFNRSLENCLEMVEGLPAEHRDDAVVNKLFACCGLISPPTKNHFDRIMSLYKDSTDESLIIHSSLGTLPFILSFTLDERQDALKSILNQLERSSVESKAHQLPIIFNALAGMAPLPDSLTLFAGALQCLERLFSVHGKEVKEMMDRWQKPESSYDKHELFYELAPIFKAAHGFLTAALAHDPASHEKLASLRSKLNEVETLAKPLLLE